MENTFHPIPDHVMNDWLRRPEKESDLVKQLWWVAALSLAGLVFAFQGGIAPRYELSPQNALTLPDADTYRQWPLVGRSLIPDDRNEGKAICPGIHLVYIDPDSYRHRREKGAFPDGTMILMEVHHVDRRESESGFGYFTNGGQDVLVSIKDRRIFEGKGWSYYAFYDKDLKAGKRLASPDDPRCHSCHAAAAEDDEVFVQYYPALRTP